MPKFKKKESIMKKLLLINGSPRKGNCSLVFDRIEQSVASDVQVDRVELRKKKIDDCFGCSMTCSFERGCVRKDDMAEILTQMLECDLMVIACPNYFQNITGILKRFFDRTTPLYGERRLRNKKLIFVFIGGLPCSVTESTVPMCANGWARPMKVKWLNTYVMQATDIGKFIDVEESEAKINNLICEINEELKLND